MTAATAAGSPGTDLAAGERPRRGFLALGAVELNGRDNGLNLWRLVLATAVLVAHGWYLAGIGIGPQVNGENMGGWAVIGFFAISGYLITASRLSNPLGAFLVHRVARIFPAFLVCLVVTAVVFGPVGFYAAHGTLDAYLTTGTTPGFYVFGNAGLRIVAWDVAGTPTGVPYPGAWSGSLWTLYYEFQCYLIVAAVLCLGWARRSAWVIGLMLALSIAVYANMDTLLPYVNGSNEFKYLFKLLPFFLAGALLRMVRHRLVLSWPLALLATAVATPLVLLIDVWGPQLASPFIAYVVLWLGAVTPSPALVRKHDISYGVYIYAWPVQQLLALAGLHTLPLPVYDLLALLGTIPLAVASWLLVERPVLRAARRSTETAGPRAVPRPHQPEDSPRPLEAARPAASEAPSVAAPTR
ncbi:acyltransferase family protein [Cellulomonas cellasea]|uniref:Acyltransferase 3 domain-containing protein n=2 Tax=Cellulomonas cellasea TaxID=43670 RepID=A0A0A0B390_9CELL|nr:acyltransferase [Cellulomonas cellasea]KGM01300.1 hypothetical protein Q760_02270 [Cellulomonas cellasea DSM 20118]GEA89974.1 acyltransferase [Cellulomonas cellasea]